LLQLSARSLLDRAKINLPAVSNDESEIRPALTAHRKTVEVVLYADISASVANWRDRLFPQFFNVVGWVGPRSRISSRKLAVCLNH